MHRQILGLEKGNPQQGDHINLDRLDNRRENLRIATVAEQGQNRRARRGFTSRYRGVHWRAREKKWQAQVKINGRIHHLGCFGDEAEAGRVAAEFRRKYMPYAVN